MNVDHRIRAQGIDVISAQLTILVLFQIETILLWGVELEETTKVVSATPACAGTKPARFSSAERTASQLKPVVLAWSRRASIEPVRHVVELIRARSSQVRTSVKPARSGLQATKSTYHFTV